MDFNKVDDPIDNQKVPITPDAGKSKHAPPNNILLLFELGTLRMSL